MFAVIAVIMTLVVIATIFVAQAQDKKQAKLAPQVLASKNDLELLKTKNGLGFRVSGHLFQQISEWEYSLDKMVFKEQVETGSFRGQYPVDGILLEVMRQAEAEGQILPYYGAGGSSGASSYYFQAMSTGFTVRVEHTVAREFLDINVPEEKVGTFVDRETRPRFRYSPMPYLIDTELPEAWSKSPANEIIFRIVGQEYQNLRSWENWTKEQAFTSRYVYQFGLVSMGSGYTIKVEDTQTGSTIDVTDYDSW